MTEAYFEQPPYQPPELNTPPTLRERIIHSRIGRTTVAALAATGLAAGISLSEATPTQADTALVYTVVNPDNDSTISIYDRNSPSMADTSRSYPDYSNYGDQLQLICGTDGESVGPNNNHRWHLARNISRPEAGETYIPDRYLNTPNKPNETTPGEPECDADTSDSSNPQPATSLPPFISYNRDAAANWALDHATDQPPDAGSCTWFISKALANGGFPQTNTWNTYYYGLSSSGVRHGTDAARITPNFLNYTKTLPYVKVEALGQLKSGINNIPDAEKGDVLLYDWENDGSVDHAVLVTGQANNNSEYPLVSGWSEDGSKALPYKQRGWTWSEKHQQFLQRETDENGNHPNENMSAFLIHVVSENDLDIS